MLKTRLKTSQVGWQLSGCLMLACTPAQAQLAAQTQQVTQVAQAAQPSEQERQRNLDDNAQWQRTLEQQLQQQRQQRPATMVPPSEGATTAAPVFGERFLISRIEVQEGAHHVAGVDKVTQRYEGTRMGNAEIFALLKEMNHFYYAQGYATTYVSLSSQNLRSGTLTVMVNWGRIKGLLLNGKPASGWKEKWTLATALPGAGVSVPDVLNVRDIDQAIENLNSLGQSARINVIPTEDAEFSWLDVVLQQSRPYSITTSVDNSGQSRRVNDGLVRYGVDVAAANLLGNDSLTLSASRQHYSDTHNSHNSFAAGYSVRVGKYNVDLRATTTPTKRLIQGAYGDYESSGNTLGTTLRATRMLQRWQTGKLSSYAAVARSRKDNYINNQHIAISSNVRTNVTLGMNALEQVWGGAAVGDLSWTRGVGLFGATATEEQEATSRYNKINLRLNWSKDFPLGQRQVNFATAFGAQYTRDALFYDAKFTIGDEYTVRGFKLSSAYADSGAYLSSTISLPLRSSIGQVTPFAGLDYGFIRNKHNDTPEGSIAGAVLGLRYANQRLNISVATSGPLKVLPNQDYDMAWYMRASFTY